jgi:hypothetical protein
MKQQTEDARLINILELASELANTKLISNWKDSIEIFEDLEDGSIAYTEQAQDIFNEYYDDYLLLIKTCEI